MMPLHRRFRFVLPGLLTLGLAFGLAGCQSAREEFMDEAMQRPYFRPANHQGESNLPASLRRVVVLPVYGDRLAGPEAVQALDEVIFRALQKTARFEVVVLTREECLRRFRQPAFSSTGVLPHDFLPEIGRVYAAEAVLFVDLTVYEPYRPLAVGYRAKLATVDDVRILWTFDESFSSSNQAVLNSARRHSRQAGPGPAPVDMSIGTLQSPRRFAAYAADAMFESLPAR
jgi:hypothetical protein